MSDNIFIKGDINDLFSSVQSETVDLPQWLNIVDKTNNETSENGLTQINNLNNLSETSANVKQSETSVFNNNFIDNLSATSDVNDIFISQAGGNVEKNIASPDDINNLINMLTAEKANEDFDTVTTVTNTSALEDQLRELLNQAGANKVESQSGGGKNKASKKVSKKKSSKKASKKVSKKKSTKKSKKASKKKSKAGKKASKKVSKKKSTKKSKKASKKASKKKSTKKSKKASKKASKKKSKAGKKASKKVSKKKSTKKSKKASKKASKKKSTKKSKRAKGGHEEVEAVPEVVEEKVEEKVEVKAEESKPKKAANPGFTAFLNLKKYVAEKLGIPNGIPAGKIAGAAKKEYTEKNPDITAVEASEGAMKYFDENMEKFKKMLESM